MKKDTELKLKEKFLSPTKAKTLTLSMLSIGFIAGLICLYNPHIDMERYVTFVKAFAILYTPLIASIGVNSSVEKITKKDTNNLESSS